MPQLGQNQQYYYSPDIQAYISTANNGVIDISEDIMSFNINRVTNQPSTAQLTLANNGFKYTPGGNSNSFEIPPVINTMDQIAISLKRETYFQVFTGFITYAPIVTLIPQPITINASCSLYKTQNSYWDAGALDLQNIIPNIIFDHASDASTYQDGGVGQGLVNILTKVCNWKASAIQIGPIPSKWINSASSIYTQLTANGQIGNNNNNLINLTNSDGIVNGNSGVITGGGASSNIEQGQNAFIFQGAPAGTAIPYINSNAYQYTLPEILARKGTNPTKDFYQIVKTENINPDGFWCSIPFPFYTGDFIGASAGKTTSSSTTSKATAFITGGSSSDPYPTIKGKSYNSGRLLLLINTNTNTQVLVHTVFASPIETTGELQNNSIVLSPQAYAALAGQSAPNSTKKQPPLAISIQGWVSSNETKVPLTGGIVQGTGTTGSAANQTASQPTNSGNGTLNNGFSPNQVAALVNQVSGNKPSTLDGIHWAYCVLRAVGIPDSNIQMHNQISNCSQNLQNMLAWMNVEGDFWLYQPPIGGGLLPSGHSYNDPLNSGLGSFTNSGTPNRFSYADVPTGVYMTAQTLLGAYYSGGKFYPQASPKGLYVSVIKSLLNNASLSSFTKTLASTPWDAGRYSNGLGAVQNILNGGKATGKGVLAATGGESAATSNYNLTNTQPTYNAAANLLLGTPAAFITDQQAITTISTLSTVGLRVFQSAPNGDFLCYYPDYFGLYGTAPAMDIYAIEIIDFTIYHDDTQLYTHIGVSGDPTNLGQGVNVVDWMETSGIVTIEQKEILNLLFGDDASLENSPTIQNAFNTSSNDQWVSQFLGRYGMRPYVDEEPMIRSNLVEFMYALQTFLMLWANQYATSIKLTFMPEIYPGMILRLPEYQLQVYVMSVSHQGSRDGGFSTSVTVTAPCRIDKNGKPVPVDFGYPLPTKK